MQVFRKFDYFRKSTSPESIKSTFLGGMVSIACVFTLGVLIWNEYQILITPLIKKNMTVSTDPTKHPHIQMNLDIEFPNIPCYLIRMSMSTQVNEMEETEFNKYLTYTHKGPDGSVIEQSTHQPVPFQDIELDNENKTTPMIKKFMDDKNICHVTGFVDLTKVKGELEMRLKGESHAYQKFYQDHIVTKEGYKVRMNHKINSLTFGSVHQQAQIIKSDWAEIDNGQHVMFNMFVKDGKVNEDLKTKAEDQPQYYFYFLKFIPHTFVDLINQSERSSYSYSLAHNQKEAPNDLNQAVTMILDYAPVKMIITKEERPFGQFMINMCSIVGGVFIIFGLINSLFNSCIKN